MRLTRQLVTTVAVGAGLIGGALTSTAPAFATDSKPCGPVWQHPQHGPVQTCPDWAPDLNVPVFPTAFPGTPVGYMRAANNNWYQCQLQTSGEYYLGASHNDWWARTEADNGIWGWVPEVYFQGGGNDEPDGALARC
ncbi:hypothetical protein [Kribbella sp. NPDC055071]